MNLRILAVTATLACQAPKPVDVKYLSNDTTECRQMESGLIKCEPKPLPTPKAAATRELAKDCNPKNFDATDYSCSQLEETCNPRELVKAVEAHLDVDHDSWQMKPGASWTSQRAKHDESMRTLRDLLKRCSPAPEEGK